MPCKSEAQEQECIERHSKPPRIQNAIPIIHLVRRVVQRQELSNFRFTPSGRWDERAAKRKNALDPARSRRLAVDASPRVLHLPEINVDGRDLMACRRQFPR